MLALRRGGNLMPAPRSTSRLSLPAVLFPLLAGSAVLIHTPAAHAYCRTTSCDTQNKDCKPDADSCSTEGYPLAWKSLCLYYGVQRDGSRKRQIGATLVDDLVQTAFDTWASADCGDHNPPFVAQSMGEVECNQPEFNCGNSDHNTNTVMFRDTSWPYDPAALAITTVTVNTQNGEILDADMEINSHDFSFTTSDVVVNNDLRSVITHEAGHFLGLAHSPVLGSTMYSGYNSRDTSIRSLSDDDIAGICDIYPKAGNVSCSLSIPPDTSCLGGTECTMQTVRKTTTSCFMSLSPTPTADRTAWLGSLLGVGLLIGRRRRALQAISGRR
ncbi:MAG TPA: matrixin family metalloprotease [Polyangiaceae bacterium]|nr:matrixin family metalloprotease [Polyangiaceae bacterium]